LPGGQGDLDGYFSSAGHVGRWWNATRHGAFGDVVIRDIEYEDFFFGADETGLFSVRCVQDEREEKGTMPIIKSKKSKNKNQKNKSKDNKKGSPPLRGVP
jgi:coenzyme F420-reducing hydrogenase beta subunit